MINFGTEKHRICVAKLDDGTLIEYDGADSKNLTDKNDFYQKENMKFIGTGVIYSIEGVLQKGKEKLRFWIWA